MRVVDRARGVLAVGVVLAGCSGEIVPGTSDFSPGSADPASSSTKDGTTGARGGKGGDRSVGGTADEEAAGSAGNGAQADDPEALDCSELKVGATPLQRLGRAQYGNAVHDL